MAIKVPVHSGKPSIMIIVKIEDKQKYLDKNFPFSPVPKLTDKRRCIHCDTVFTVSDYVVTKRKIGELICCPNVPECDGSPIDWVEVR